jgi:hypothetical protein
MSRAKYKIFITEVSLSGEFDAVEVTARIWHASWMPKQQTKILLLFSIK